jgi:hypothetical protein
MLVPIARHFGPDRHLPMRRMKQSSKLICAAFGWRQSTPVVFIGLYMPISSTRCREQILKKTLAAEK